MAQQWALAGNCIIAAAYAAITMAILVPVVRAGQLRTNRLATATALIFFSCAIGHALHAAMYWQASLHPDDMAGMHDAGFSLWPSALWDVFTAGVGVYYWTLRRGYGILLSGALFVDPAEQDRRHEIELRERIAAERAQAEAMLRAVITNSQSAIYVKDLDGHFLLANETFQAAFGVTEDEVLGQTDDYLDPDLAPVWQANDRQAHHGPIHTEEADGRGRLYESNKFPLYDADGHLYAICGVSLDVTDLRAAAAGAEAARDEALAQSQVKSEFLATMSHEIRTPMNGVLGLASLLMGTELDPAQRRYATGIHSAGNALLGVINDILDFSKIEAGKIILDPDDFDLPALLTETAALVTPTADTKGLKVVTRRGPGLPASVRGDGGRVRQILLNLAGNAVKFTAQGSVTIRATLAFEPAVVRFEVTDTGVGIDPADAERLFEPFTQADASTTRTYGGTGLGLAISRQLTEAMGGTMGVDSEPGQGSTFWCEIPFEPPVGTSIAPVTAGPGLRVLTIGTDPGLDDDLRRWTMTVTTAAGTAALDQLRDAAGHGLPFDVMLIDADADPGDVDIRGLARLVTADDTIPAVHIVVLNDKGLESDIGTYLPKPVSRSALYDLLAQSRVVTAASVGPASAPPADRGHLLLVEDNDINQMVATGILTSLGYHTDVASNGAQAVDMARATDYDAILMDCRMPVMDGFTATAELRQLEAGTDRHTPIIAMTASALVADRERCLAAGMDDYLAKPVNPSELDAALHRWITQPAVVRPSPAAPGRDTRPAPAPSRGAALPSSVGPAPSHRASAPNAGTTPAPELVPPAVDAPLPSASSHRGSSPHFEPTSDWDGRERRQPASGRPDAVLAPDRRTPSADHDSDPIGQRLDELAGDRSGPELALVNRLVESFLQRAPLHLTALTDAFNAASPKAVEDEAHTLKGAAGNVGALAVMDICARIEDDARARTLTNGTADDMRRLRLELERVDHRLRAVVAQ